MKFLLQFCVLALLLGPALPCMAIPSLVDHYRKALDADPQNQTLRYHLGVALLNQGQNHEALKEFRLAYSQRSSDPEINFNLALLYRRLGDPDSSLLYLDQARDNGADEQPEIYPLQNVYFNLVLLYEQQGRLEEALALLQDLFRETPSQLDYQRLIGHYQLRLGRTAAGLDYLVGYLQQVPEDNETREFVFATLFNLGLAAYATDEVAAARREFERALLFAFDETQVLYHLALLDYQQDNFSAAVERVRLIFSELGVEQQKTARSILYNSALSLKQQQEYAAAQGALEPLRSAAQPRPKDLALLAAIQLEVGEYALARATYYQIFQMDPNFSSVAEGILASEKGAFEELLDAAGAAFAADGLPRVRNLLMQASQIYPKNNRLRIYQMRLAKATRENWQALQRQAKDLEGQESYVAALATLRQGLLLSPNEQLLLDDERRLLALLSDQTDMLLRQGGDLYRQGDLQAARRRIEQLVALNPEHQAGKEFLVEIDSALHDRAQQAIGAGESALAREDLNRARQLFSEALAASPGDSRAKSGLERANAIIGRQVARLLMAVRRAQAEGELLSARNLLTAGLQRLSEPVLDERLVQIESAIEERQTALFRLAEVAIKEQDFKRAEKLLTQVKRLGAGGDELVRLQFSLSNSRAEIVTQQLAMAGRKIAAGSYDAGLKAYRRVLDLEPDNSEALSGLKQGRKGLSSSISQVLNEGATALEAGNLDQARQAYLRVLSLDPHESQALAALKIIERVGRSHLSRKDSQRLYLAGIESYTEGDYRQAISIWDQVLDLDPGHEKARMNIDKAERKIRQIQERQGG